MIDKLDKDETAQALASASALARQVRQVVIPEIDTYVYGMMCEKAGLKQLPTALTPENIYEEIIKGTNALDNEEVPETERVHLVTPDVTILMKKSKDIIMETDISNEMSLQGVIGILDGNKVVKVPLPANLGFMIAHSVATLEPTKQEDYRVHDNPPGISGDFVEGRICYDAFVLKNKAKAIYYQEVTTE